MVCRNGAPDDGRAALLALTDQGREMLKRAAPVHAACVREVLTSRLSDDEQRILVNALARLPQDDPAS